MLRIDVELPDHDHDKRGAAKKANKPLMEKRRRARINRCLYEMKQMLVDSIGSASPGQSKWEKADILEMSVAYMRQLQQRAHRAGNDDPLAPSRFLEGFSECVKETRRFSGDRTLPSEVHEHNTRLNEHLAGRLRALTDRVHATIRESLKAAPTQDPGERRAEGDYSPSDSQTSPSSSSSSAASPKCSSIGIDDPPTPNLLKRRRKNTHFEPLVAVPLPSTLSVPSVQPNKLDRPGCMRGREDSLVRMLPAGVDPGLMGQFLSCVRPVGIEHLPVHHLWPPATDLIKTCADVGAISNPCLPSLWRPF